MYNPFIALATLQINAMQGWMKAWNDSLCGCQVLMANQMKLFEHPSYQRLQDICFRGADLNDHYGKRSTDVDVGRV